MNSLEKFTYPLFESIKIENGEICNPLFHERRFRSSYVTYFQQSPRYELLRDIDIEAALESKGVFKLRISYNLHSKIFSITPYKPKNIETLRLVRQNGIDYRIKYNHRGNLADCFAQRAYCDDVLIAKDDFITDTSYCNITFYRNGKWYTPKHPLLKGTETNHFWKMKYI